MTSSTSIWCLGIVNVDALCTNVESWPQRGGLARARRVELKPGGVALNTAITLATLGGYRVGLIGCIGSDHAGTMVLEAAQRHSVDTRAVLTFPGVPTGVCCVAVFPDGERSFITGESANDRLSHQTANLSLVARGDMLHIGGGLDTAMLRGDALRMLVEMARRRGMAVSMDTAWDESGVWWEGIAASLPMIDMLMTNQMEAECLTGEADAGKAARKLLDGGAKLVVIKLGDRGAYLAGDQLGELVPGFSVSVVDSTGAGDAFAAGFLYGVASGWGHVKACEFANAVGAMCVTQAGAMGGIGTFQETQAFIQEHSNTYERPPSKN